MTEHANTPAWQTSPKWRRVLLDADNARQSIYAAEVAVAADRAHLATLVEALREYGEQGTRVYLLRDAVLDVLRDAP